MLYLGSGCSLFSAREPEPPVTEAGTYVQPDEPDAVIANLQKAVEEMIPFNYERSLAADFEFVPDPEAVVAYPILQQWDRNQEAAYFRALVAAVQPSTTPTLQLDEITREYGVTRHVYTAGYTLTVAHLDAQAPRTVQGSLVWEIEQGPNNLWQLRRWTDRNQGDGPSWSDLKAEFAQ